MREREPAVVSKSEQGCAESEGWFSWPVQTSPNPSLVRRGAGWPTQNARKREHGTQQGPTIVRIRAGCNPPRGLSMKLPASSEVAKPADSR